jgi:hypothetical protein
MPLVLSLTNLDIAATYIDINFFARLSGNIRATIMQENRRAVVVTPSSAGVAIVEPPKRLRAKLTNDPMAARASRNTARGRRIADLYRAYAIALGSPSDTVTLSNVLAAAELKAASELMRDKLLAGAAVDPVLLVKIEGLANRAERKLGVRPVTAAKVLSLAEHLAAKPTQKATPK